MSAKDHAWQRAGAFLRGGMWDVDLRSLRFVPRLALGAVRIVSLVFKGFWEDDCPIFASALTFNTLMALVPILILSLAFARGLGNVDLAKDRIRSMVSEWTRGYEQTLVPAAPAASGTADAGEAVSLGREIDRIVERAFDRFDRVNFGALGGVGFVFLLWMVIILLFVLELSFNRVWGLTRGRPLTRRLTDYLTALIVLPVLVVLASWLPAAEFVNRLIQSEAGRSALGHGLLRSLLVVGATSGSFIFLVMFMPNTRVKPVAGVTGGLIAGGLFIGWLKLCAVAQGGAARYGALYGSFAVFPIVLVWIFVSWEILLLGGEVAFAIQNVETYRMESGARRANLKARAVLALSLVAEAARVMAAGGDRGMDPAAYARRRRVPARFLNEVVDELVRGGLLAELAPDKGRYVLLRAPAALTAGAVMDCVLTAGVDLDDLGLREVEPAILKLMARADTTFAHALGTTKVADLV